MFCLLSVSSPVLAETFQQKLGRWFVQGDPARIEEAVADRLEDKEDPALWLELASLRKDLGDLSGAIQAYGKALDLGGDWKLRVRLAQAWVQMGELENALTVLSDLEKEHGRDPELLWALADVHLQKAARVKLGEKRAEWSATQKYLRLLVGLKPDLALGLWHLAEVTRQLGESDRALDLYTRVLRKDGSFKGAHWRMARLLLAKGDVKLALLKYEQAKAVEPDNEDLKKEAKLASRGAPEAAAETKRERKKQWEEWKAPEETVMAASPVTVRVGLATGLEHLLFRSTADLVVTTPSGTPVTVLPEDGEYHVVHLPQKGKDPETWEVADASRKRIFAFSNRIWIAPSDPVKTIALYAVPSNSGYFFAREEDRAYRGLLEISPRTAKGFQVINRVSLEGYLAGVLPAEMPTLWPLEAQKAQAVVARTYALSKLGRHNGEGFDVCDSVHCQVYRGIRGETQRSNEAVNSTAGWILKKGGKLVPVVFSAQCGGHTQDYEEAWGYPAPVVGVADYEPNENKDFEFPLSPYGTERWIREEPQAYCRTPDLPGYQNYRWAWEVSAKDLQGRSGPIGRLKRLKVTHRTQAGFVQSLVVEGTEGSKEVKGDSIRRFLGGVRSNLLWIEPQYDPKGWPESFIIYGGGWGHGIGMCQVGCMGMAKAGKDFQAIVKHYFPEGHMEKLQAP